MEACIAALQQAFWDYRHDIEEFERKRKPMDGLFGIGRTLQDDGCHDRLDKQVRETVERICALRPSPDEAEKALTFLLAREDASQWPVAAQWMLRAVERHGIPLIPYLTPEQGRAFLERYTGRYKRWDRLPAQKEVVKALKARAASDRG